MLDFKPERSIDLRARFPKCLERTWDVPDDGNMPDRPGLHREHVFDFFCGLRLLISRDTIPEISQNIHVSASWEPNAKCPPKDFADMNHIVDTHYHFIGGQGKLVFLGMSRGSVPHWIVKE